MPPVKKIWSYLFPCRLRRYASKYSGVLEINLIDGKKTLDTSKSNYSYGSLQKILHRALLESHFDQSYEKVLVLGMGGGSVVQTIRDSFHSNAFIELVEIDPEIIRIARDEFRIQNSAAINIVNADALQYVKSCGKKFGVVIVDLFIIDEVPAPFVSATFIADICRLLAPAGLVIFNTMRETMDPAVLENLKKSFVTLGFSVKMLALVENSNDVIIATSALNKAFDK
jgi:spermidine synthase